LQPVSSECASFVADIQYTCIISNFDNNLKILRHLLGITRLDKEKYQYIRGKNGSTEHSKGNKIVPEKVATTCTEAGHKQTTKTSTNINQKDEGT